jgi:hypothetical protein
MQPPLFLWEPNDLIAFDSVEEMEAFIEPPDVHVWAVRSTRPERLLDVTAEGRRVRVQAAEAHPTHQDELRGTLDKALRLSGHEVPESASLAELASTSFDNDVDCSRRMLHGADNAVARAT